MWKKKYKFKWFFHTELKTFFVIFSILFSCKTDAVIKHKAGFEAFLKYCKCEVLIMDEIQIKEEQEENVSGNENWLRKNILSF